MCEPFLFKGPQDRFAGHQAFVRCRTHGPSPLTIRATSAEFITFHRRIESRPRRTTQHKGVVCDVRVEDIEDPLMQKIRYLDNLVDELARGKKMQNILRV